jgi:hypothetical protein
MYQWQIRPVVLGENLQRLRRSVECVNIRKEIEQTSEICSVLIKTTVSEDEIEIKMCNALHIAG